MHTRQIYLYTLLSQWRGYDGYFSCGVSNPNAGTSRRCAWVFDKRFTIISQNTPAIYLFDPPTGRLHTALVYLFTSAANPFPFYTKYTEMHKNTLFINLFTESTLRKRREKRGERERGRERRLYFTYEYYTYIYIYTI